MADLVPACAAGKIDGKIAVDLKKEEDNYGEADLPVAIIPRTKEIVLLQMDGNMSETEFETALNMAMDACMKIYELQKDALKRKYITDQEVDAEQVEKPNTSRGDNQ
jgi:exosome complex component RRP41